MTSDKQTLEKLRDAIEQALNYPEDLQYPLSENEKLNFKLKYGENAIMLIGDYVIHERTTYLK